MKIKRFKLKSWIYFIAAVSMAGYAVAVSVPNDPVLDAVKQLKNDTDAVFLTKASEEKVAIPKTKRFLDIISYTSGTDQIISFNLPAYQSLLKEFTDVKAKLEKASIERQASDMGKGPLSNMAQASKLYFEQQRRLYNNFYRNTHINNQGDISNQDALDKLDLRLMSSTALTLLFDDGKYQARYNLWHPADNLDQIEYGFSPQDRTALEEKALTESPSEKHYAELVQLMVVRERVTNQWGLDRMVGAAQDPVSMNSDNTCASNLYSFHPTSNGTYYSSLWSGDHKDEFDAQVNPKYPGLVSVLKNATASANHSLISSDALSALLQKYFNHWSEYKAAMALEKDDPTDPSGAVMAENLNVLPDNYFKVAPDQLITAIANQWSNKDSSAALEVANLPADAWDFESVSNRTAREMFHYQRKYLIDALVNEASGPKADSKGNALAPRISYVANHVDEARQVASQMVDEILNAPQQGSAPIRVEFQRDLSVKIQKAFEASEVQTLLSQKREQRFQDAVQKIGPALTHVGRADFVAREIVQVESAQKDTWRKQGLWATHLFGDEDYQLSFIPHLYYLSDEVILYTPDQLASFFNAKLSYLQSKSYFSKLNTNGVTNVAKKIQGNDVVMAGVKNFFGALAGEYQKTVFELKKGLTDINEDNTPLYGILPDVLASSYASFKNGLAQNQNLSDPDRSTALDLYVQAMSLMSLGIKTTGKTTPVTEQPGNLIDVIRNGGETNFVSFSVNSPLDIENILQTRTPQNDLRRRIVQTLMDQRIAAQVIKAEMIASNPILAVRQATDIDAPKLADYMVNSYSPSSGVNSKAGSSVNSTIRNVLRNADSLQVSLLTEACQADPHSYQDEKFKNIFLAAPVYRQLIYAEEPKFKPFDSKITEGLKSNWQKIEEYSDPILSVIGVILLIAAIYFFGPIVLAGLGWGSVAGGGAAATGAAAAGTAAAGGGALSTFLAGAGSAYAAAVTTTTGIQGICASLLVGKAAFMIGMVFVAQAIVHTEVSCYELPEQLKYQLRVAQTQIGIYTKPSNTNAEIEKFAAEIHSEKVSTYVMIAMNATVVPSTLMEGVHSVSEVLGLTSAKALSRLTTDGATELANSIREATWKELVDEKGSIQGTSEYISQKLAAIAKLGRINTIGASATVQDLRGVLSDWFVDLMGDNPEGLRELEGARVSWLTDEATRVEGIIRTQYLKEFDAAEGAPVAMNTGFISWIKKSVVNFGISRTQYAKILIDEKAFEAIKLGEFPQDMAAGEKQAALALYTYLQDIKDELTYYKGLSNMYDLLKNSGEVEGAELLKRYFSVFGDADWARMEELFSWNLSQMDKSLLANIKPTWFAKTQPMAKIQAAFGDYHTLRGELNLVHERYWGSNADPYFTETQQVDALNSQKQSSTVVSTLKTADEANVKPGASGWVQLFIPPEVHQ